MKQRRQRTASILLIGFFVIIAGLTLFSNTFQTAMLPKVATENSQKKKLNHLIKGSGSLTAKVKKKINSDTGGKIMTVHVKKDEFVKKDQVLVTFNNADLELQKQQLQLQEAEVQLKKQRLNRETLKEQFVAAHQSEDELAMRKAKRDLQLDQLDMDLAQQKIDSIRKELARNRTVTAPYAGRVTELEAEEGASVSPGQALLTLAKSSDGFEMSLELDEVVAELLQTGSEIPVSVKTKGDKILQVKGTVDEIRDAGAKGGGGAGSGASQDGKEEGGEGEAPKSRKTIVIHVLDDGIQGGEQATVQMEIGVKEQGLVLRKKLLKKDGKGSYVYVVREKKSSLGNKYLAEKAYVSTGDEVGDEVVILQGLTESDDIIAESSEPLQEGNRVRLK